MDSYRYMDILNQFAKARTLTPHHTVTQKQAKQQTIKYHE